MARSEDDEVNAVSDFGNDDIMTDESVRQNVIDELSWEPSVDGAHIGVGVKAVAQDLEVHHTS